MGLQSQLPQPDGRVLSFAPPSPAHALPGCVVRRSVDRCLVASGVQGASRDHGLFQAPFLSAIRFCYSMRGSLLGEPDRRVVGVYVCMRWSRVCRIPFLPFRGPHFPIRPKRGRCPLCLDPTLTACCPSKPFLHAGLVLLSSMEIFPAESGWMATLMNGKTGLHVA